MNEYNKRKTVGKFEENNNGRKVRSLEMCVCVYVRVTGLVF